MNKINPVSKKAGTINFMKVMSSSTNVGFLCAHEWIEAPNYEKMSKIISYCTASLGKQFVCPWISQLCPQLL